MALVGYYNWGGIDVLESYVRVTRFQTRTNYVQIGESSSYAKYLHIEYDYAVYKDKVTALANPSIPLKESLRNRFSYQIVEGGMMDIWYIIYADLKQKETFSTFDND